MYAVVRTYEGAGAKDLFDLFTARRDDIDATIRTVPGFESYILLKTETGGLSVTVCQDKEGAEESSRVGKAWVAENAGNLSTPIPRIDAGEVILKIG